MDWANNNPMMRRNLSDDPQTGLSTGSNNPALGEYSSHSKPGAAYIGVTATGMAVCGPCRCLPSTVSCVVIGAGCGEQRVGDGDSFRATEPGEEALRGRCKWVHLQRQVQRCGSRRQDALQLHGRQGETRVSVSRASLYPFHRIIHGVL